MKKRILTFALALIFVLTLILMPTTIAANERFTPVWNVAPPLAHSQIILCVCGEFFDAQERIINPATGQLTGDLHGGHGGGGPGWVFDPVLNMFGHPGRSSEYNEYIGMYPLNDFDRAFAAAGFGEWLNDFFLGHINGLLVVESVDSTMRQRGDWWSDHDIPDDWWDLAQEARSGKFALMYNRQLTTGFDFDQIQLFRSAFDAPVFEFAAARIGNRWGLIDRNGNAVIPFEFTSMFLINEHTAFANLGSGYGILNLNQTMANVAAVPELPHNLNSASTWARESITTSIELDLVPQNLQSSYTANITRAEFAALAVSMYETATGRTITERATFNDTSDINVQKMGGLEVVGGVGGGNFNPDGAITRQEAAVILSRLANTMDITLPTATPDFTDNNLISDWAVMAIGAMQQSEIMGGVGGSRFDPSGSYTREQSIITILRLFEMIN